MAEDYVNRFNSETNRWEKVPRPVVKPARGTQDIHVPTDYLPDRPPVKTVLDSNGVPVQRYARGSHKSAVKLHQLKFDPIEELVRIYNKLKKELEWHEEVRDGSIVPLLPSGKPRNYSSMAHMAVYDKLNQVCVELLRYGYGRVPETLDLNLNRPMALIINTTKKGEPFIINDSARIEDAEIMHENDLEESDGD